ncbi:hypothetical protein niasHT_035445 [Heterodera trifolii]|uniref:Uncharacterized protein n=1 Tax=Heterodera trifolii TaxID=157864 RepID=A0ABD2HXW8_9BILA
MMMFMWDEKDVVYYESIAHAVRGVFAICNYGAYIFCDLGKKVNDRLCCLCSLFVLLFFHLVTFSWPFLPENVHSYNGTLVNSSKGCDISQLNWCEDMTRVNIWVYYIAISSCIGIAFSNINITMNTLFSHIIGPRMQSKQQGMLEMFGGFGRMLGPLLIGFMYTNNGPRVIWLVEMGEIVLMIALWLFFYRRLVPLKMPADDAWTDRESTESEGRQQNGKQSLTGSVT